MLKKHLKVISFGLMAICSYEILQASEHEQLENYSEDFIVDKDILTDFDDTNGLDKEPDYQSLPCDKREDRDLALMIARRAENKKNLELREVLRLAVMKRLEHQHVPTASSKSELSLPSSSEYNSVSTLSSPDSIQRPSCVQRQVAMTFLGDARNEYDADSEVSTPDNQSKDLTSEYLQFSPIVHTELSSMRTRAGSSPVFPELSINDGTQDSLSLHGELVVENIEDGSSDYVEL